MPLAQGKRIVVIGAQDYALGLLCSVWMAPSQVPKRKGR